MSFASPIWLLALLAVPLAIAAAAAQRRRASRYAIRFPATATLARAVGTTPSWRRFAPAVLALAAMAVLALALARPRVTVAIPIQGASFVLVTDHSGSMAATDVDPDRLTAAESAASSFLSELPSRTRVGVVTYADAPDGTQAPTTDRELVQRTLDAQVALGATATGEALQVALDTLSRQQRSAGGGRPPSAIVLLSDGKTTIGRDPVEVAREAARLKIPIYTVALGTEDATIPNPAGPLGAPIPVPPDPETLRQISRVSGGRAFTTGDADELGSIYKSLGSQLATKHEHREVTAAFAGAGLVLLLAGGLLSLRWSGRLP
ncbi:MAG TPA: VWA domain-containing protein [Baekduia sp.]|nr:VWA domain-containing protein [Baekduia sp.]